MSDSQAIRRFNKNVILSSAFGMLLTGWAAVYGGRGFYVRPSGDDATAGSSVTPLKTVGRAVELAGPGDTIYIGEGIYYEQYIEPRSGNAKAWVMIRNVPGERPVLNGGGSEAENYKAFWIENKDYIEINGLVIRDYYDIGIDIRYSGRITVRNCEMFNNGSAGVAMNYALPGSQIIVEDCVAHHNGWGIGWASGIHINNKGIGTDTHHIIRRNICYNNYDGSHHRTDGNGLMFDVGGGGYCLIENNLCFNNAGSGINVLDGSAAIINNTLFRNAWDTTHRWRHEISVDFDDYSEAVGKVVIRNNIIWARSGVPVAALGTDEITFDNNLCWSDEGEEGLIMPDNSTDLIIARPLHGRISLDDEKEYLYDAPFIVMDTTAYDFRLISASPAIDASSGLPQPQEDIVGRARPYGATADLGAYEYILPEDINRDGLLNILDVVFLILAAESDPLNPCYDLDADGSYSLADVLWLLEYLVGVRTG